MADSAPMSYSTDPALYLYTSLSSGSSKIVTATARLSSILKANKVDFKALDVATDEKARMIWGRRAGKRLLPGLVRQGMVLADLDEVEEWNEYGEVRENLLEPSATPAPPATASANTIAPSSAIAQSKATAGAATSQGSPSEVPISQSVASASTKAVSNTSNTPEHAASTRAAAPMQQALRQAGFEAAKKASEAKVKARDATLAAAAARKVPATENNLSKLDNSGPPGMPPPSGVTTAEDAAKPETGNAEVSSKADDKMAATKEASSGQAQVSPDHGEVVPVAAEAPSAETEALPTGVDPSANIEASPGEAEVPVEAKALAEAEAPSAEIEAQQAEAEAPSKATDAANATISPPPSAPSQARLSQSTSAEEPLSSYPTAPLVPESAILSTSSLPLTSHSPQEPSYDASTHRGSHISAASAEEIKQIEQANLIPEEPEAEEEASSASAKPTAATEPKTAVEHESALVEEHDIPSTPLSSTSAAPIPIRRGGGGGHSSTPEPAVIGLSPSSAKAEKDKHIRFAGSPEPANEVVAMSMERERASSVVADTTPATGITGDTKPLVASGENESQQPVGAVNIEEETMA